MQKSVRVADVVVRPRHVPPEPLTGNRKPQEPILVREDMVLVDGLRRLNWYAEHGIEEIPAIVTSDWPTLVAEIARQHRGRTVTYRRMYEFGRELMAEIGNRWAKEVSRIRRKSDGTFAPGGKSGVFSARKELIAALNATSHVYQDVIYLYSRAYSGQDDRAYDIALQVDSGELSPDQGSRKHRMPHNLIGHVTNVAEQRRILERGVAGAEAHVQALRKLGFPLSLSFEEVSTARKALEGVSREMTQLIYGLRKWEKENG